MIENLVFAPQAAQPVFLGNASTAVNWCNQHVCSGPTPFRVQLAFWIIIVVLFLQICVLRYRYNKLKKIAGIQSPKIRELFRLDDDDKKDGEH